MGRFLHVRVPRLVLVSLLLSVFGCASRYHEPPRTDVQAASLEALAPVWISSIDHAKVSRVGITGHKQFRILPGSHAIEVEYSLYERSPDGYAVLASSKKPLQLVFTAAPGRTYYVKPGRYNDRWRPYVTDSPGPVYSNPN